MTTRIFLFDGQGSRPSPSPSVQNSSTPLAELFVRQTRSAFVARIAALEPTTHDALNTRATRLLLDRIRDGRIILPSSDASLLHHPLVALPSLYVTQVVRLLEELETNGPVAKGTSVEVIGYSSGILPALLVATSFPSPSAAASSVSASTQITILRTALALFKVAVTIGIEAQISKEAMLNAGGISLDDPSRDREWSAVIFGANRDTLEAKLSEWNSQTENALLQVHLTAQTTATCHTVSGIPSILREFLDSAPNSPSVPSSYSAASASQTSLLSSSLSLSSWSSVTTEPNSLSRKSSASSFSTSSTSSSPCPTRRLIDPQTPDNTLSPFDNFVTTPACTYPPRSLTFTNKPLDVCTLFHASTPLSFTARDRVLAGLFPSSQFRESALSSMDSPETPTIRSFRMNASGIIGTEEDEEIRLVLSALRLSEGFALYDMRTGCIVSAALEGKQLVELAVDSIFLGRIEFLTTLEVLVERLDPNMNSELVNFGPGTRLARAAMRDLKERGAGAVIFSDHSLTSNVANSAKNISTTGNIASQEPIAIVGMAVNFPGARDSSELWRVLEQGLNTVEEIPETRFSISQYTNENPSANPGRQLKTHFGNFLPDELHAGFDNAFFRISPREARALDPQMRVLMRVGLQAMEAAGLVVQDFGMPCEELGEGVVRSADVGCFVGAATNDYVHNLRNEISVHYATGTLPAFLAGRLSYALHLSGPSVVLDTACSSSLVAIHQACRALLAGDCKAALAGGVNVICSPDAYLGLDRAHFLSPTGNCKPWDASADGYCRAEGSGMFVLKRLSDALASSDNILGVIRGTEVNQSAAAISITRPHGLTQATLFRTLLDKSGVRPEEVTVVEAHGTGTQAGDPEELRSLRDVLSPNSGSGRDSSTMLTMTSLKGNIGHAEAASGAASLAKIILMLRHRSIPPQVGLNKLNPKIEPLKNDFTHINTSAACVEWMPNSAGRRIALVNNFGAAGSNAALLVEEAPACNSARSQPGLEKGPSDHVIVGLSAETENALLRLRDSYISSSTDSSLVGFGYTATTRRKLRPWRIAVTADSAASLVVALSQARPTRISSDAGVAQKKIIFVFSGQGGQHIGMGRQLYKVSSSFRSIVDVCHENLVDWGYPGVLAVIDAECNSRLAKDDELVAFQCAMFVLECALCDLWKSWGVKPDAVIGHSLGEYASLVAAGVLSLVAGLRLVAHRARLMVKACQQNTSGMLLVRLPAVLVSEMIATLGGFEKLSIACYNGPNDVIVGGPKEQLRALKEHFLLFGSKCFDVDVPFAYHTEAMDPVLEDLSAFARNFEFAAPAVPVVSSITGKVVQPGDMTVFNSEYFAKHCRQAVQFEDGARGLADDLGMIGAFIEIGAHPTTLPLFAHLATSTGAISLHSLHKRMTPRSSLCSALSRLFVARDGIAWGKVYRDLYPSAACMEIPGYPLVEKAFWAPFVEDNSGFSRTVTPLDPLKRFSFLDSWTQKPSSKDANVSEFETSIEILAEYITGHNVASSPLCPASVYYELALSAATCTLEHGDETFEDALTLSEVQFTLPLVYDPSKSIVIRTSINLHPSGSKNAGTFTISSIMDGMEQNVHCTGFFQRRQKDKMASKLQLHYGTVERGQTALLSSENGVYHETLRKRTIYELIFSRVVQYSKLYQVIETMTLDERNGEGFATFRLSPEQASKGFVAQPIFIDALLHAAGFLINSRAAGKDAFICNQVDASKILFDLDHSATFEVYCTTAPAGEGMMLADAWAIQTGESRRIVAHMKRMRFSRVRLSSLNRHLSRSDDIPSRNSTPGPFFRHQLERCETPVTPGKLGSPFRPAYRTATPSSVSTASHATFDMPSEIISLIADLCGIPVANVALNSNIADLGVDSLIWIELIGQLKAVVQDLTVDVSDLMLSATVGELIKKIEMIQHCSTFEVESPGTHTPFSKPEITAATRSDIPNVALPLGCSSSFVVKDILGRVLDMPPCDISEDDSLEALGLDSLGSIEALAQLQEQFETSLPHDFFIECPTISSVQKIIAKIISQRSHSRQSSSSTLVESEPLQSFVGPERTLLPLQTPQIDTSPLFLVHDGSGLSQCYSRIGTLNRSLWGINNPKLVSGESWEGGVAEMATHYIDQIKPMVTDKGCILGGWSFGGVVAFHMACEMMRSGVKVAGVVLIDSPSPFTKSALPEELIDAVICATTSSDSSNKKKHLIQLARTQMTHATKALVAYEPLDFTAIAHASEYPDVVMLRCADAFSLTKFQDNAVMQRMPFLEDRSDPRTSVIDWERLIGKQIPVLDIPGHHFEPFAPKNAPALTQQLNKAISHFNISV